MKTKLLFWVLVILSIISCEDVNDGGEVNTPSINSNKIQVIFEAINIPNAGVQSIGTGCVMAGYTLRDSYGDEYSWCIDNDGNVTSNEFIQVIQDDGSGSGILNIVFYYEPSFNHTDFKIFQSGESWVEVLTDPNSSDGNFKVDLSAVAVAGDRVKIIFNCSDNTLSTELL